MSIEFCRKCKGYGWTSEEELVCYHKGLYDTHYSDCDLCLGTGREEVNTDSSQVKSEYSHQYFVSSKSETVSYKPFNPVRPDLRATDHRQKT